ncbi:MULTISPECIES: hypothetical protein [unclassified Haematobacter]|uniref:hypothetical protein n=1 Tax=unclassified Haematobacter TaxID=2640585 RepID=UPI0025BC4F15|nr:MULTISPECIES: hypothetical protein [unclassified Haematobacter]
MAPLAALPLAGAAAAAPLASGSSALDTPILRLFRQHRALLEAADARISTATGPEEDEEIERLLLQPAAAIEDEMLALPCTCAADFAAKLIAGSVCGGVLLDWETDPIWREARALTACAA